MNKIIKYTLSGFAFIIVGLLAGFQIKDSAPGTPMATIDDGLKKLQKTFFLYRGELCGRTDHDKRIDDAIKVF
ncbi:MAG: hypothetical protein R3B93_06540 [Bacteroidia bacterium]